jgi:hypothetical protein
MNLFSKNIANNMKKKSTTSRLKIREYCKNEQYKFCDTSNKNIMIQQQEKKMLLEKEIE